MEGQRSLVRVITYVLGATQQAAGVGKFPTEVEEGSGSLIQNPASQKIRPPPQTALTSCGERGHSRPRFGDRIELHSMLSNAVMPRK